MSEHLLNHVDPLHHKDLIARVFLGREMVSIRTVESSGPLLWLEPDEARALRDWLNKVVP